MRKDGTYRADLGLAPRGITRRREKPELAVNLLVVAGHPPIVP